MSTQPATPSSNQRGSTLGTRRGWRRRLLLHHLPFALASAVVLVLFMSLPVFDTNRYRHVDIFTATFPKPRNADTAMSGPMQHGGAQPGQTQHGGAQPGQAQHGGSQPGQTQHGGAQPGQAQHGSQTSGSPMTMGGNSFLGLDVPRFTVGTGYVATGLLALTLLIGPVNLLLRRRNPVSTYLRRDAGTWTTIFCVVHVIYGLQVHGSDLLRSVPSFFFASDGSPLVNSFGLGNWTGLAATVIVVGLLALSSDVALRKLKAKPWKRIQRLNYAIFALVVVHAFFYGALLRTESSYTRLLLASVIAVFLGQVIGIWLWRHRNTRRTASRDKQRSAATP
jgi:sulfoxide reductase heme-binding subunit YedZ